MSLLHGVSKWSPFYDFAATAYLFAISTGAVAAAQKDIALKSAGTMGVGGLGPRPPALKASTASLAGELVLHNQLSL
jgi:hypothetical protein